MVADTDYLLKDRGTPAEVFEAFRGRAPSAEALLRHAGLLCKLQHLLAIAVKGVVGQVAAYIYQFHGAHFIGIGLHIQWPACTPEQSGQNIVMEIQWNAYWRLMRFDKPIGILLLLWPTWWALLLAGNGMPTPKNALIFTAGVVLMRAAGCVMNDIADRYYAWSLDRLPEQAYFYAIDIDSHDGLVDNSPEALAATQQAEDAFRAGDGALQIGPQN